MKARRRKRAPDASEDCSLSSALPQRASPQDGEEELHSLWFWSLLACTYAWNQGSGKAGEKKFDLRCLSAAIHTCPG